MEPVADWQSNARLVTGGLRKVQETAKKHDAKLSINYTRTDGRQCSIGPSGYHLLWSGPYADATAAMRTCNQLGWKKRNDWRYCYGRTIDRNYTGKRHIGPDGRRW
jgi:hypothetical protein